MSYLETYSKILTSLTEIAATTGDYLVTKEQPWIHFNHKSVSFPGFGFKVHVTLTLEGLDRFVVDLVRQVVAMGFSFKMPCDFLELVNLNCGLFGESQVGKVFTIYTVDPDISKKLIEILRSTITDPFAPKIASDFYYDERDCVSLRYGEIGPIEAHYDLCGRAQFVYQNAGHVWNDKRDGTLPVGIELPQIGEVTPRLLEIREELTPEILGFSFKVARTYGRPLKKIFLVQAENGLYFIVKQVYRFAGECEKEQNYEAMLAQEFKVLKQIDGTGIGPKPIRYFVTQNFAYLIMEDLVGDSCDKLPPTVIQTHIEKLLGKIALLHRQGIIHRDIKLGNILFLPCQEDFRLIDFELAEWIGNPLPCSGGTANYRHPEALTHAVACEEFDWYSVRSMLMQVALGSCPSTLPIRSERFSSLLSLNGFKKLAHWIDHRLPSSQSSEIPTQAIFETFQGSQLEGHQSRAALVDAARDVLSKTTQSIGIFIHTLGDDRISWRNHHLEYRVHHQGINIGAAGILLGLRSLHGTGPKEESHNLISRTARYLATAPIYKDAHGFMTGNAGVAVALAAAYQVEPDPKFKAAFKKRLQVSMQRQDEPDFFFGMSGIIYACIQVAKMTGDPDYALCCAPLVQRLMSSITDFDGLFGWLTTGTLGGEVFPTLGMSHGIAGNASVLFQLGAFTEDADLKEAATEIMMRLFSHGRSHRGSFLRVDVHPQSLAKAHNQWCHGGAGVLWGLLMSEMWREESVQELFQWAAIHFLQQPVVGNPTMCHGLGGMLETAMMLQKSPLFANDARDMADRLARSLLDVVHPTSYLWCSEDPRKFTPDLWVGHLGPASALGLWLEDGRYSVLQTERHW